MTITAAFEPLIPTSLALKKSFRVIGSLMSGLGIEVSFCCCLVAQCSFNITIFLFYEIIYTLTIMLPGIRINY